MAIVDHENGLETTDSDLRLHYIPNIHPVHRDYSFTTLLTERSAAS